MPLQNHLHLALALGASPEFAPVHKWKAFDRLPVPEVFMTLKRSQTGVLHRYLATNAAGPIRLKHMNYTLKVDADFGLTVDERLTLLEEMHGEPVFLCDHMHANDGTSHAADTRIMIVRKLGPFPPTGMMLPYYRVDIELEDASL